MIGILEVGLLTGVLVAAMTWLVTVLRAPGASLAARSPFTRAFRARLWLYAPLWVPTAFLLASALPSLFGKAFNTCASCLSACCQHVTLCLVHNPHDSHHPIVWGIILLVGALATLAMAHTAKNLYLEWSLARTLVRSSRTSSFGDDVRLLDCPKPQAFTVGILRPTILLSSGLVHGVTPQTLRIVLAHERAHIARRDTLFALLDRLMSSLLPTYVRRDLLRDLSLAREQACDARAAQSLGHLQVAAALTSVARLGLGPSAIGLSIAASSLEYRVYRLLDQQTHKRWPLAPLLICLALFLFAATGPAINLVEHIDAFLLH